jgi:hypothetical protein
MACRLQVRARGEGGEGRGGCRQEACFLALPMHTLQKLWCRKLLQSTLQERQKLATPCLKR